MRMQGVMLTVAWSIAATAFGREPDVAGIKAYELPAYTLVTADPAAARAATRAAAQADAVLGQLLDRATHSRSAPTILALFPNSTWARYLAPGKDITGLFVPGPFANYVVVGVGGGGGGIERGVMHEYAHCFLHTQFGGFVPLWFDEGIAQFAAAT